MAVVLPSGNYVGGGRSRAPDLSGVTDAAREWNIRMDVPQQQRLEQYGLPGLAYLATTGDQQARRFLDRYYGRGNWEKYTPSTTYDEEGNPTLVPPSGVPWDQNQRARMGVDLFGFDFTQEEIPTEIEKGAPKGPRKDRTKSPREEGPEVVTEEPVPEPEPQPEPQPQPPRRGEPQIDEGVVEPEPEATEESEGRRIVASMQGHPPRPGEGYDPARAEAQRAAQRMEAFLRRYNQVPEGEKAQLLDPSTSHGRNWAAIAQYWGVDPIEYYHQVHDRVERDRAELARSAGETIEREIQEAEARRQAEERRRQMQERWEGYEMPTEPTPTVPETLQGRPQSMAPMPQPNISMEGGQPAQMPGAQLGPRGTPPAQMPEPEFVARTAMGDVRLDAGNMGLVSTESGEVPVGIVRDTDPQTGRPVEGLVVGKSAVEIQGSAQHRTAEHVRDYLATDAGTNRHKGSEAALKQTVRQTRPAIQETVNQQVKTRMIPHEAFARQVDSFIRSDPEGASVYFTEAAQAFMEARNIEARTALASEQARRTRMETDALETLGGSEFIAEQTRLQNEALQIANDKARLDLRRAGLMLGIEEDLQKSMGYFTKMFENKLHMSNAEAMAASLEMTQGRFIQAFFDMFNDPQAMQQMGQQLAGFGEDPYKAFGLLLQIMNLDSVKENPELQTELFNIPLGSLFRLEATRDERNLWQQFVDRVLNRTPPTTLKPTGGDAVAPDPDRGADEAYDWSREKDL